MWFLGGGMKRKTRSKRGRCGFWTEAISNKTMKPPILGRIPAEHCPGNPGQQAIAFKTRVHRKVVPKGISAGAQRDKENAKKTKGLTFLVVLCETFSSLCGSAFLLVTFAVDVRETLI